MAKKTFSPVLSNVNFIELEKKLVKTWYEEGIVEKYLHKNDNSKTRYSFLDGPITANNPMGVHHAWGRTYKDLWQRFHTMLGDKQRYQNGFDCQGLWVEVEVEKELGIKAKKDIENLVPNDKKASIARFVQMCRERVKKYSSIQTEQTKRLGNFMDWDHSYYTMSDENNYMIWHFLKVCHEKGWVYKGKDSVPWCPRCETAISQHEMLTEDYKEVVHKSIYLELPIVGRVREYLLVWTTTPWTIPANIAVAVDRGLDYALVEGKSGDQFYVVKERVEAVFGKETRIVKVIKGKELVGLRYVGPFDDLPAVREVAEKHKDTFHTVIATDPFILPVSTVEGTGLVHTAVSAGSEDFKLGKKYGLPMIPVISDTAEYLPNLGFLSGKNAKKHPEVILDYLEEREKKGISTVFLIQNYKHRYPACWRCKTELVWKVEEEWYIGMDLKENSNPKSQIPNKSQNSKMKTLREQMVETAKMIDWHPEFGLERELEWLGNMHDWLISKKNRYWGLALPIYECHACGTFEIIGSRDELKKRAVSGWDVFHGKSPHKPFIDEVKIRCTMCGKAIARINDVGNVWLDAGIVPFSTLVDPKTGAVSYTTDKTYWKEWFPFDFVTESFPGQFKNWFYSLIAMSTVLVKRNPFQTLLGYASVLDEKGNPMHKSAGNFIEFSAGADTIGVDVMRWMYAGNSPVQNLLFGYKKADKTRRRVFLILWNIYNFFVTYALIDGYEFQKRDGKKVHVLDRWILSNLYAVGEAVKKSLLSYEAMTAVTSLESFISDFSQWYVRRSRERVGPIAEDKKDKEACFDTMYEVLTTLVTLLAPFAPFISDEIFKNLTGEESVHLTDWPRFDTKSIDHKLMDRMSIVREIVEQIHAKRKELKLPVRQPLAKARISNNPIIQLSNELLQLIKEETNIKSIEFSKREGEISVELDTTITPELKQEGHVRELIRTIQSLRKEKGCALTQKIIVTLPKGCASYDNTTLEELRKKTLAGSIVWGTTVSISTLP